MLSSWRRCCRRLGKARNLKRQLRSPRHLKTFRAGGVLEDIGAGDGVTTECERCGKPGTPRQQSQHIGVTICYLCADERVDELRMKDVVWD